MSGWVSDVGWKLMSWRVGEFGEFGELACSSNRPFDKKHWIRFVDTSKAIVPAVTSHLLVE